MRQSASAQRLNVAYESSFLQERLPLRSRRGSRHQSRHSYRRRSRMKNDRLRRAAIMMTPAISVTVPNAATIGTMDAVCGSRLRAVCARATCLLPLVATELELLVIAAFAAGSVAFGILRSEDATVPSCDVPVGVPEVGFVSAFTAVSVPLDDTRARSDVLVCSVVVDSAFVVSTGWVAPWASRRA